MHMTIRKTPHAGCSAAGAGVFLPERVAALVLAAACAFGALAAASSGPERAWAEERTGSVTVHVLRSDAGGGPAGCEGAAPSVLPSNPQPVAGAALTLEKLSSDAGAANGGNPAVTVDSAALPSFPARTGVTDESGECAFEGLERGIYRVTGRGGGVPFAQSRFLVAVPMRDVEGTDLWDVQVYPKLRPTQTGEVADPLAPAAARADAQTLRGRLLVTGDDAMMWACLAILAGSAAAAVVVVALLRCRRKEEAPAKGADGKEKSRE